MLAVDAIVLITTLSCCVCVCVVWVRVFSSKLLMIYTTIIYYLPFPRRIMLQILKSYFHVLFTWCLSILMSVSWHYSIKSFNMFDPSLPITLIFQNCCYFSTLFCLSFLFSMCFPHFGKTLLPPEEGDLRPEGFLSNDAGNTELKMDSEAD